MESKDTCPGREESVVKGKTSVSKCWNGEIKLWKAFFIVHLLGLVIAFILGSIPHLIMLSIADMRLPHIVTFIPFTVIFPFGLVCLWRSSPNPKIEIKGALVRFWVCLASVYYFALLFRVLTGPQ